MIKKLCIVILLLFISNFALFAQDQHVKSTRESIHKSIGDNFIWLYPDTVAYPTEEKSYRWNYEQGLMLYAFWQLYLVTNEKEYFDYIKKNIDYYIEDNGNIKTYRLDQYNIDNVSPGRVLLFLYQKTNDAKYKLAADNLMKQLESHPRTKSGGLWHKKIYPYQMWLDGLYMAQPFNSMYASLFNKKEIFDDITKQFDLVNKNLKDNNTGLYFHGWDESREQKWANPETGVSPNFWGRSIGWFMMSLVDVLDYFPESHPLYKALLDMFVDLSASILEYRDNESLLWYQVVDAKTKQGNYIETSASSMFIYSMAKGYNKGYLNKKYSAAAQESYDKLLAKYVRTDCCGNMFLTNVCSVAGLGGNPYRDGSFEYYISEPIRENDFKGYGPFLLSAIELAKIKE